MSWCIPDCTLCSMTCLVRTTEGAVLMRHGRKSTCKAVLRIINDNQTITTGLFKLTMLDCKHCSIYGWVLSWKSILSHMTLKRGCRGPGWCVHGEHGRYHSTPDIFDETRLTKPRDTAARVRCHSQQRSNLPAGMDMVLLQFQRATRKGN